jgi:hypothetical protein
MPEQAKKKVDFDFDNEHKVMQMFSENAKLYIQLGGAALALSIAFARQIQGVPDKQPVPVDAALIVSWALFLLAIGAGGFYQYLAVKYLERQLPSQRYEAWDRLVSQCGLVYGVMLISFYGGSLAFTLHAFFALSGGLAAVHAT